MYVYKCVFNKIFSIICISIFLLGKRNVNLRLLISNTCQTNRTHNSEKTRAFG